VTGFSDRNYLVSLQQHLSTNDIMLGMMASRNVRRDDFAEALRALGDARESAVGPENLDDLL
jgi:hypothetical protein